MSETVSEATALLCLLDAHRELDDLLAAPLTPADDDVLVDGLRDVEVLRNRLAAWEHHLIAELDARGVALGRGLRNTAALVHQVARCTPAEAAGRVSAARRVGPRQRFGTGERLDPVFPTVAAALAAGTISTRHARVITDCIHALPSPVREDAHDAVEDLLVTEAVTCDPGVLATAARQVHAHLDPDGTLKDPAYRERTRSLDIRRRPDGSAHLDAELTAQATERLLTVLDALTHPRNLDSTPDGTPDGAAHQPEPAQAPRASATQRRHDALLAALTALQVDDATKTAGGVHTTLILTLRAEDYTHATGLARTGHGTLIPTREALRWAGGNPELLAVTLSTTKGIEAYSHRQRCYTEPQRLAMIARDGGCTFPDCDAPIWYCEADHITPWTQTKRTSVDDGHLVCTFHHRHARSDTGWQPVMIYGRPAWRPPAWIDPDRTPRHNTIHRFDHGIDPPLD